MIRATIITKVYARMDEVLQTDSIDVVPSHLVEHHLDDAALRLLEMLPANQQQVFSALDTLPHPIVESDHLYQPCPLDMVKIARVRLPGWSRTVNNTIYEGNPNAQAQVFRYMKGTALRPVVVMVQEDQNQFALQMYPRTGDKPDVFLYVKKRLPEQLEDALIDSLCYITAARCFEAVENMTAAKICYEWLAKYIEFNKK